MRYLKFQKSDGEFFHYQIADSIYQTNQKYTQLEHLLQAEPISNFSSYTNNSHTKQTESRQIYHQETLIGDSSYNLKVSFGKSCYQVVNGTHNYLVCKNAITSSGDNPDIILLAGPLMMLNLSMNAVFCLHASAFNYKGKTFILMAQSGTGKSTIARYINTLETGTRIADDIVPLTVKDNQLTLLANFPQLKVETSKQYHGKNIDKEIVLIFAQTSKDKTCLTQLNKLKSIKKIISHSVATRLFAQKQLESHLSFCHQLSQKCESYHLDYQHNKNSLKELTQLLDCIK